MAYSLPGASTSFIHQFIHSNTLGPLQYMGHCPWHRTQFNEKDRKQNILSAGGHTQLKDRERKAGESMTSTQEWGSASELPFQSIPGTSSLSRAAACGWERVEEQE